MKPNKSVNKCFYLCSQTMDNWLVFVSTLDTDHAGPSIVCTHAASRFPLSRSI